MEGKLPNECCYKCRFARERREGDREVTCFRYPPKSQMDVFNPLCDSEDGVQKYVIYQDRPVVSFRDWCGEFQRNMENS